MPTATPQTSKRRWLQYSLRTLLLFVLVCSIPCTWFNIKLREAKRQSQTVEELRKLGWVIRYDFEPKRSTTPTGTAATPPGPAWLRERLGIDFFSNVVEVGPTWTAFIHPVPWEQFRELPHLQIISLGLPVTDNELENIEQMTQLKELHLRLENMEGAAVEKLQRTLPDCRIMQYGH